MKTTMKADLYYDKDDGEFEGRALTPEEYETISQEELQQAIGHSIFLSEIDCEEDEDARATHEFYELSVEQLKQRLKANGLVIVRYDQPHFRNVFPLVTRGPRTGLPNFKKEPVVLMDRIYGVAYENEMTKRTGDIEVDERGNFTILEEVA